jgi:hypothetical protein
MQPPKERITRNKQKKKKHTKKNLRTFVKYKNTTDRKMQSTLMAKHRVVYSSCQRSKVPDLGRNFVFCPDCPSAQPLLSTCHQADAEFSPKNLKSFPI